MRSVDTYMTIGPNGEVSFDFQGHISANGIDLISGDNDTPPNDRKIIWHKTAKTGAVVAELIAFNNAGAITSTTLRSQAQNNTEQSSVFLTADSQGGREGQLSVTQSDTASSASSFCRAWLDSGNINRTIINGTRKSNFLQIGGPIASAIGLRLVAGQFQGTDGATLISGTFEWTCVRNGVGQYTVTFNPVFSSIPLIYGTLFQGVAFIDINAAAVGSAQVWVINTAGAFIDANVAFLAIGGT